MTCNSTCTLPITGQEKNEHGEMVAILNPESGSKTELALLKFWEKTGKPLNKESNYMYEEAREEHISKEGVNVPFTSKRKRMTTEVKIVGPNGQEKSYLLIKGASEYITKSSSHIVDLRDGSIKAFDEQLKN